MKELPLIPKENYYSHMYDIEGLTSLNREAGSLKKSSAVLEIEKLICSDECNLALEKLENISEPLLQVLRGALTVKNLVLEGTSLSPKHAAVRELSEYLALFTDRVEKNMLVEVPVAKAWEKFNPDPTSEESVTNFYIQTDAYLYELMAANHIVQTLYSFYVMTQKMKELNITKIIDYGAGAGTLCILLKRLGYNVVYADLPGKLFDFAQWRFERRSLDIPMIDLSVGGIDDIPCDCILCTEVIEHVVHPEKLLSLFSSKLPSGGTLIVSESCAYTDDFCSHLLSNKKYAGDNFISLLASFDFVPILTKYFIPQLFFKKE